MENNLFVKKLLIRNSIKPPSTKWHTEPSSRKRWFLDEMEEKSEPSP